MLKTLSPAPEAHKTFCLSKSSRNVLKALAMIALAAGCPAAQATDIKNINSDIDASEWQYVAGDYALQSDVSLSSIGDANHPMIDDKRHKLTGVLDISGFGTGAKYSQHFDVGNNKFEIKFSDKNSPMAVEKVDGIRVFQDSSTKASDLEMSGRGSVFISLDSENSNSNVTQYSGLWMANLNSSYPAEGSSAHFGNDLTRISVTGSENSKTKYFYGINARSSVLAFDNKVEVAVRAKGAAKGVAAVTTNLSGKVNAQVMFKGDTTLSAELDEGTGSVYGVEGHGNGPVFSGGTVKITATNKGSARTTAGMYLHPKWSGPAAAVTANVESFEVKAVSEGTDGNIHGIGIDAGGKFDVKAKKTTISSVSGNDSEWLHNQALYALSGGVINIEGGEAVLSSRGKSNGGVTVMGKDEGIVNINADKVTITSTAAENSSPSALTAVYAQGGTVSVNSDSEGNGQGKTVCITGNILSKRHNFHFFDPNNHYERVDKSVIGLAKVNLTNAQSMLTGSTVVDEYSTLDLGLKNGAVWNVTADSSLTTLKAGGGSAYLGTTADDFTTLARSSKGFTPVKITAQKLTGTGNSFYLRADIDGNKADSLWINQGTGSHKLYVRSYGAEPSAEAMSGYLVHQESGDASFTLGNTGGYVDAGTYIYKLAKRSAASTAATASETEAAAAATVSATASVTLLGTGAETADSEGTATEWYLRRAERPVTPSAPVLTPSAETVLAFNGANNMSALYWGHLDDLRKRLGEVRGQKDMTGLWASAGAGYSRFKNYPGLRTRLSGFRLNVGADRKVSDTWLLGGYLRFSTGDEKTKTTLAGTSNADVHSEGLALYATKLWDSGAYLDLVASADLFHQEIHGRMLDGSSYKGNFSAWNWGFSAEAGHQLRFGEKEQWFVEPSVQLAYFRAEGPDYRLNNGMQVDEDTSGGLTGRAGALLGHRSYDEDGAFSGDAYLRAGVISQFGGGHDTVINGNRFEVNGLGTRWYAGAGGEIRIGKASKLYGYLETQHGNRFSTEIEGRIGWKTLF
jgi:outer membrane autotransporter protein